MSGKKKKPAQPRRPQADSPLFDISQIASMTECTGILPAQTETAEQGNNAAALAGICPMPGALDDERKRKRT